VSEPTGPEGTAETGTSGQSAEEITAIVLPVLTGMFRDYFQEHPEAWPDVRAVLGSGGAEAMAGTLGQRQDDIQRALEAAQQAEATLAAETGLAPQAQAAAQAAEFAMDTMGMVVAKPIDAICGGPLQETLAVMAQELRDDPDEDPAELAELDDEEFQLMYHELFGDLFEDPEN
jgi:L-rhamnose mutarotase